MADGRVTWGLSVDLVQVKPGTVPLPGARLRYREGPMGEWHEVNWPDILKEARPVAPPESVPPEPPSPWPGRLLGAGSALTVVLVLVALGWVGARWLHRPPLPLPAHARALQELARLEGGELTAEERLARLAEVLRGYLAERFGLDAGRRTSDELVGALSGEGLLTEEERTNLRNILAVCDLAKFARISPSLDELAAALARARALVEGTGMTIALSRTSEKPERRA